MFSVSSCTNHVCAIFYSSVLPGTGCACRFLYGPETKDEHKSQIEKSLEGKIELKLEVIFYKKSGKYFSESTKSEMMDGNGKYRLKRKAFDASEQLDVHKDKLFIR